MRDSESTLPLSVVIPAWGAYLDYLPALIPQLDKEGVREIIVITQGEPVEVPGVLTVSVPAGSSVGATRNRGLAQADPRIPYVVFFDADDLPVPGALRKLCEAISPTDILCAGRRVNFDGSPYPWPSDQDFRPRPHWRRWLRQLAWNHIPLNSGTIIRTDALRDLGGWPDAYLNSDDMLACALLTSGPARLLDQPTARYRVHEGSLFFNERNDFRRWMRVYRQQRRWLAHHPQLSRLQRQLFRAQLPFHIWSAFEMDRRARPSKQD